MSSPVFLVQPCPPHEWSHAPTVGYFSCSKCSERIEHSDPRYGELLAALAKLHGPSGDGGGNGCEWNPHLDYAGEPMMPGEFRDPPEESRP